MSGEAFLVPLLSSVITLECQNLFIEDSDVSQTEKQLTIELWLAWCIKSSVKNTLSILKHLAGKLILMLDHDAVLSITDVKLASCLKEIKIDISWQLAWVDIIIIISKVVNEFLGEIKRCLFFSFLCRKLLLLLLGGLILGSWLCLFFSSSFASWCGLCSLELSKDFFARLLTISVNFDALKNIYVLRLNFNTDVSEFVPSEHTSLFNYIDGIILLVI